MTDALHTLSQQVGSRLLAKAMRLVTAESCTGGLVAAAITEIAGSSDWFERGLVTYSNKAKMDLLDVPKKIISEYGAVSEETAHAMAEGALINSRGHISVSITGIAGPGGAVPGKPVGTVCFGWSIKKENGRIETRTETLHFQGDRSEVRQQSTRHALNGVLLIIT